MGVMDSSATFDFRTPKRTHLRGPRQGNEYSFSFVSVSEPSILQLTPTVAKDVLCRADKPWRARMRSPAAPSQENVAKVPIPVRQREPLALTMDPTRMLGEGLKHKIIQEMLIRAAGRSMPKRCITPTTIAAKSSGGTR